MVGAVLRLESALPPAFLGGFFVFLRRRVNLGGFLESPGRRGRLVGRGARCVARRRVDIVGHRSEAVFGRRGVGCARCDLIAVAAATAAASPPSTTLAAFAGRSGERAVGAYFSFRELLIRLSSGVRRSRHLGQYFSAFDRGNTVLRRSKFTRRTVLTLAAATIASAATPAASAAFALQGIAALRRGLAFGGR